MRNDLIAGIRDTQGPNAWNTSRGALEACVSLEASVTNVTRKWICIPAEIDKGLSINDTREEQGGIKARDAVNSSGGK